MDKENNIKKYEDGNLSNGDTLKLFSELIKSKKINDLQDRYKRKARELIRDGFLNSDGDIICKIPKTDIDLHQSWREFVKKHGTPVVTNYVKIPKVFE